MDYVVLNSLQAEGIQFLIDRERCILGDDVGLGKTRQAGIAIERIGEKAIIFTFGYLKSELARELNKRTGLRVTIVDGERRERQRQYRSVSTTDVWIVSYELIHTDWEEIYALPVGIQVLDEGHAIRNYSAKRTRRILDMPLTRYRWLLTASLLDRAETERSIDTDLYNLLHWIRFTTFNSHDVKRPGLRQAMMHRVRQGFEKNVGKVFLRRTKDVLGLPPLMETNVRLDMPAGSKTVYDEMEGRTMFGVLSGGLGGRAHFTHLREFCNHPALVGHKQIPSPKLDYILNFVEEAKGKVVIFSDYRRFTDILRRRIPGAAYLSGGLSMAQKDGEKERFRTETNVLLCTQTGELGHNLQFANYLINAEIPFTPKSYDQRIGRIHRTGQTQPCHVYNLMMSGTVEERILNRLYIRKDRASIKMNKEWMVKVLEP